MSALKFIKTKIDITVFIACVMLVEIVLIVLSPIIAISMIWAWSLICFAAFLLLFWVTNIRLLCELLKLDKSIKNEIIVQILLIFISFIVVFISFFVWKNIAKKINSDEQISIIKYDQPKSSFIRINYWFAFTMICTWISLIVLFLPAKILPIQISSLFGFFTIPFGLASIGLIIHLTSKFKNITQQCNDNNKGQIYYEILWITFFLPILAIWLLYYINQKIEYSSVSNTDSAWTRNPQIINE